MVCFIFHFVHTFVLSSMVSLSYSMCTDVRDCFSTLKPGKLRGHIIKTLTKKGYRDCYNECSRHPTICVSFNYNKFNGRCELNSMDADSMTLTKVTGFVYSLVPNTTWNDPCSSNQCSLSQMCVALSSGAVTCVNECETYIPIDGSYSVNLTEAYFKAGETIDFDCAPTYTKVNTPDNVCLASGTWKQKPPPCAMLCSFEEMCPYLDEVNTGFKKNAGATLKEDTGCSYDHTTGYGHYYYFDSSRSISLPYVEMNANNTFRAGERVCVTMWYQMYGNDASLYILTVDSNGIKTHYFVATGSNGDTWNYSSVVILSQNTDIIMLSIRGSSVTSDICIDDVMIYLC